MFVGVIEWVTMTWVKVGGAGSKGSKKIKT